MTALAIFAKTPGLSPVKTRLARTIGETAATQFHRAAARIVGLVAEACRPALHPYWAVAERDALEHDAWRSHPTLWQGEGGLGERMHRIHATLLERHGRVLMIGCDSPQVSAGLLRTAADRLETGALPFVMGPARDGGFWLFGGRRAIPAAIWTGVAYSQADTGARLRDALAPLGGVACIETLGDVDEAEDLAPMAEALRGLEPKLPEQAALAQWIDTVLAATAGGTP